MNGQQKAEANFQVFEQWIGLQTPESFTQITHRGKLKRGVGIEFIVGAKDCCMVFIE